MIDENLFGAVYIPDDGWLEPNGITAEFAHRAKQLGAEILTGIRVTGIEFIQNSASKTVRTDHGPIQTESVVNAARQWAPRIGKMVEANLPIVPMMHQYMLTGAMPGHERPKSTPVVRDPENLVYLREEVGGFLVGGLDKS